MFRSSYFKSLLSGYLRTFLQIAIAIFLTPFILKFITKAEYGSYSLAQSSILLLSLINFGFGGALNVFAARNNEDNKLVSNYASITATFQILLGILGLVLGIVLSFYFTDWFNIELKNNLQIQAVVIIFSLGFFVTMVSQTYTSLLTAYRQIHIDNIIGIFTMVLNSLLVVVFLYFGVGILGMAIAVLFTQTVSTFLSIYRVKKYLPNLNVKYFRVDKYRFKEMFQLGIWFFVGSISTIIIEKFDQILTGKLVGIETVAILIITAKLFELVRVLIYSISNNFRPYLGKMVGEGEILKAYNYFVLLRKISIVSSVFLACIIIYINKVFVEFWVGLEYYGGDILTIALGFNLIYYSWKLPNRAFLTSNLVIREQSSYGIIEGAINLFSSYFLGLKYGLLGIISGTFISGFIFQLFIYGILLHKKDLEIWGVYLGNNLKLLFQTTILIGFTVFMVFYFPFKSSNSFFLFLKLFLFSVSLFAFLLLFNLKDLKLLYYQKIKPILVK